MTTLYEKRGKRYHPVSETDACGSLTEGNWLVTVKPGLRSIMRPLLPDFPEVSAAAIKLRDLLVDEIRKAQEAVPRDAPPSKKHKQAWDAYRQVLGGEVQPLWVEFRSIADVADAAIKRMMTEHYETK